MPSVIEQTCPSQCPLAGHLSGQSRDHLCQGSSQTKAGMVVYRKGWGVRGCLAPMEGPRRASRKTNCLPEP